MTQGFCRTPPAGLVAGVGRPADSQTTHVTAVPRQHACSALAPMAPAPASFFETLQTETPACGQDGCREKLGRDCKDCGGCAELWQPP